VKGIKVLLNKEADRTILSSPLGLYHNQALDWVISVHVLAQRLTLAV